MDRRFLLKSIFASLFPGVAIPCEISSCDSFCDFDSLRNVAEKKGIYFGGAIKLDQLSNADFSRVLNVECNLLVAEYESKRQIVEPQKNFFSFKRMDAICDFAFLHGMKIRGHTLVWHLSNPGWLAEELSISPSSLLLEGYIHRVVSRYKGKIRSWDVVNEPINPIDGRSDGLRNSIWLRAFGPSYISRAFFAANEADPDSILVLNDYNTESIHPTGDKWRYHTLKLLEVLKNQGVPIHAYGMQAHLDPHRKPIDFKVLDGFVREINNFGLGIKITELDVRDFSVGYGSRRNNLYSQAVVEDFLRFVLGFGLTDEIVTWGISDRYSWLNHVKDKPPYVDGVSALPFDNYFCRKPMWLGIYNAIENM